MKKVDRDNAGVIVKPPFIYLGFLTAGIVLGALYPAHFFAAGIRIFAGTVPILSGVTIVAAAFRQFQKAGTNVNPFEPTLALVTAGVYRFSRNPMYVSLTAGYLGIAIAADNLWAVAFLVPILLIMHYGVILREEKYLERKFGGAYRRYKSSTRRWL